MRCVPVPGSYVRRLTNLNCSLFYGESKDIRVNYPDVFLFSISCLHQRYKFFAAQSFLLQ